MKKRTKTLFSGLLVRDTSNDKLSSVLTEEDETETAESSLFNSLRESSALRESDTSAVSRPEDPPKASAFQKQSDAFNVSVELRRLVGSSREPKFLEHVRKKYCPENFMCWLACDDLIADVRNDTLESIESRNSKYFKIYADFVDLDGPYSVTIPLALKEKLEELKNSLEEDPTSFDTRPVLVLQKEAEVLLVRDLKAFCSECPHDEELEQRLRSSNQELLAQMTLDVPGLKAKTLSVKQNSRKSSTWSRNPRGRKESVNRVMVVLSKKQLLISMEDVVLYSTDVQLAEIKRGDDSASFWLEFKGEDGELLHILLRPDSEEETELWVNVLQRISNEYQETQKAFQLKRDKVLNAPVSVNRDFEMFVKQQQLAARATEDRAKRLNESQIKLNELLAARKEKAKKKEMTPTKRSAYFEGAPKGMQSGYNLIEQMQGGAYDVAPQMTLGYGSFAGKASPQGQLTRTHSARGPASVSDEGSSSEEAEVEDAALDSDYAGHMYSSALPTAAHSPTGDEEHISSEASSSYSSPRSSSASSSASESSEDEGLDDFNAQFQAQVAKLQLLSTHQFGQEQQRIDIYTNLIRVAEDFRNSATRYGRIIISEVYLSPKKKTIRPNTTIGGVIGGEKYIVGKILFKFAIDSGQVFGGSDEHAAKVAGLELKGLQAYFNLQEPGLHFPLMALIDYKGFRLIASSLLPLGKNSLAYGSQDAARTIHKDIDELTEAMERTSAKLNLKPHKCGTSGTVMATCVDIEGHLGLDGRFYLLDFSRVFPPVTPNRNILGSHLFQMFRPEFVQSFKLFALCSDGYSNFTIMHPDAKEHMDEIDLATTDLLSTLVQNFASEVSQVMEQEARVTGSLEHFRLTQQLHSRGINVRYLGAVLKKMGRHHFAGLLLAHMCARVAKNDIREALREKMRKVRVAIDEPFRQLIVEKLNLIFGNTQASKDYWEAVIKPGLNTRFDLRPANWIYFPKDLRGDLFSIERLGTIPFNSKFYMFETLRKQLALVMAPEVLQLLKDYPQIFQQEQVFDDVDVADLGERVKFMDVISSAQGYVFSHRAIEKERLGLHQAARSLFERAYLSYQDALNSTPNDSELLRSCALVLIRLHRLEQTMSNSRRLDRNSPLVITASTYFKKAIQANRQSCESYSLYARFLADIGENVDAEAHFLESLVKDSNQLETLEAYAEFLKRQRRNEMAQQFQERAQHVRKKQDDALRESSLDLTAYVQQPKTARGLEYSNGALPSDVADGAKSPRITFAASPPKDGSKGRLEYSPRQQLEPEQKVDLPSSAAPANRRQLLGSKLLGEAMRNLDSIAKQK